MDFIIGLLFMAAIIGCVVLVVISLGKLVEESDYAPYRAYKSVAMIDGLIEKRINSANDYLTQGYPALHREAMKDVARLRRRRKELAL